MSSIDYVNKIIKKLKNGAITVYRYIEDDTIPHRKSCEKLKFEFSQCPTMICISCYMLGINICAESYSLHFLKKYFCGVLIHV